jgi:hypothetical protein
MFFENIIPMFPIFHRPTFVFRDCAPPLLLNAIALGALFLGSQDAIAKVVSTKYRQATLTFVG